MGAVQGVVALYVEVCSCVCPYLSLLPARWRASEAAEPMHD